MNTNQKNSALRIQHFALGAFLGAVLLACIAAAPVPPAPTTSSLVMDTNQVLIRRSTNFFKVNSNLVIEVVLSALGSNAQVTQVQLNNLSNLFKSIFPLSNNGTMNNLTMKGTTTFPTNAVLSFGDGTYLFQMEGGSHPEFDIGGNPAIRLNGSLYLWDPTVSNTLRFFSSADTNSNLGKILTGIGSGYLAYSNATWLATNGGTAWNPTLRGKVMITQTNQVNYLIATNADFKAPARFRDVVTNDFLITMGEGFIIPDSQLGLEGSWGVAAGEGNGAFSIIGFGDGAVKTAVQLNWPDLGYGANTLTLFGANFRSEGGSNFFNGGEVAINGNLRLSIASKGARRTLISDAAGNAVWSPALVSAEVTLTNIGTTNVWVDLARGNHFKLTATNNFFLQFTNVVAGQYAIINIAQDATGSRTMSYDSATLKTNASMVLSTAASTVDTLRVVTGYTGGTVNGVLEKQFR